MRKTGTVKNFERCWGFIAPDDDSNDIFAHVTQIVDGQKLQEGDTVTYEQGWNARKAKAWAENITGGNGGPLGKGGGSNSRGTKKGDKAKGCSKAESKHDGNLPEGLQAAPQQPFTWPFLPPPTKVPPHLQAMMQHLQICSMQAMQLRQMQAMQMYKEPADRLKSALDRQKSGQQKLKAAKESLRAADEALSLARIRCQELEQAQADLDAEVDAAQKAFCPASLDIEVGKDLLMRVSGLQPANTVKAPTAAVGKKLEAEVGFSLSVSGLQPTSAVQIPQVAVGKKLEAEVDRVTLLLDEEITKEQTCMDVNSNALEATVQIDETISLWVTKLNGDKHKISGLLGKSTVRALQAAVAKELDVEEIHKVSLLLSEQVLTEETCMDESLSSLGLAEGAELQCYFHDAAVGEHVDDPWQRYQKVRELGTGCHGAVWLAIDRQCGNREVAIKRMVRADKRREACVRREAAIMKMLNHPNICKLFDVYLQGRFMYFIMESCTGGELWERIYEEGRINEDRSRVLFQQVGSALDYAHGSGIAHRDLKPENVCFIGAADSVKVIDWGLSSWFAQGPALRKMATPLGSGPYQAPEVQEAKADTPYTAACDLWSLGVLLYVMLCGEMPRWAGEGTFYEQLQAKKEERFPMDSEAWSTISPEVKDVIKSLLKAEPTERLSIKKVLLHPWLTSRPASEVG